MRLLTILLLGIFLIPRFGYAIGGSTCAEATVVGALPYADSGQLESGVDPNCPGEPVNDLFYEFTAPSAGTYRFDMCGSNNCCFQQVRLWTDGTCCSGASVTVDSGCVDGYPQYDLTMTSGQVVYIEVGKSGGEWGVAPLYQFNVSYIPPPGANCSNAIAVNYYPYTDTRQLDTSSDPNCSAAPFNDIFYVFTATSNGIYNFNLCLSDTCCDLRMRLWTDGTCCEGNQQFITGACLNGNPRRTLNLTSGQVVYVEIGKDYDEWTIGPEYTFSIERQFFATEYCPGGYLGTAPTGGALPTLPAADDFMTSCGPIGFIDRVYRFSSGAATVLGLVMDETVVLPDQIFEIREGDCDTGRVVACHFIEEDLSKFAFAVTPETEYFIIHELRFSDVTPRPVDLAYLNPGDHCLTAIPIETMPFDTQASVVTQGGLIPLGYGCDPGFYPCVWFRFTAPSAGGYRFTAHEAFPYCYAGMTIWTDGTCCSGNSITTSGEYSIPQIDLTLDSLQVAYVTICVHGGLCDSDFRSYRFRVIPSSPTCHADSLVISVSGDNVLLQWGTVPCEGTYLFDVHRSATPDFEAYSANRIAVGLTGNAYWDPGALQWGDMLFYKVVTR